MVPVRLPSSLQSTPPRNLFPQVSLQGSCLHRLQEEPHYWAPTCPLQAYLRLALEKLTRSWGKKTESQRHHLPTSTREYAGFFFSKAALSERVPVSPGSNLSISYKPFLSTYHTPSSHFPFLLYLAPEPRAYFLESSCSTSLPSLHSLTPKPSRAPCFSSPPVPHPSGFLFGSRGPAHPPAPLTFLLRPSHLLYLLDPPSAL